MYLMYVDESGDCGTPADKSPTKFFCLSGVIVHELRWRDTLEELLKFRYWLKRKYGVYLAAEIHAGEMISKPAKLDESLRRLRKFERLAILRHCADQIARLPDISVINIVVNKQGRVPNKEEVFRWAWYSLFQCFENTIYKKNFPGPRNEHERGVVFPDTTDGGRLTRFLKEMRRNNPLVIQRTGGIPIRQNQPIQIIIEDPIMRDSRGSYLIQAADCVAFLLKQKVDPSLYMRKHGGNAYFHRLDPVLCKHASNHDPHGIVRL